MLLENLDRYKLSTTDQAVTSFAGLPLLLGMGKSLGLEERLNALPVKERERGYRPAESIFSVMGLIQAGGESLDDIRLLAGDEGMQRLLGDFPAANTLGEFLRRFGRGGVHRLGWVVLETAAKVIRACRLPLVTIDIDAYFLESQKEGVLMNYDGLEGYCPVMVSCAELKMPLAGAFRSGNASPMANLASLLRRVLRQLSGLRMRARSDSAGYQAKVIREFDRAGVDFTITARKDDAVLEAIRSIPREAWKKYDAPAYPHKGSEIAETVHAFGEADKDIAAFRLIVVRWPQEPQGELFEKERFEYHAVATRFGWEAGLVLQFHRNRQDGSENVNKEMKGGFGLWKLPCRDFMANAAYFQMAMLAAVVTAAFKHLVLPKGWQTFTIQTLRFRLIRLAGTVCKKSRYLWLKIPGAYPFRDVFEAARYRVLGVGCEIGSTG
jgi:hypothetical protein